MKGPLIKIVQWVILLSGIFVLCNTFIRGAQKSEACLRDISQITLMGCAIRNGDDPYQAISNLREKYCGERKEGVLDHPTPYPPSVAPLAYILSFFDFGTAFVLWGAFSIILALCGVFLIFGEQGTVPSLFNSLTLVALMICSSTGSVDLFYGQFGFLFFFIFLLVRRALEQNRDFLAGFLIGCMVSLKFFGWPFVIAFVLLRKWKSLLAFGGTIISSFILSVTILNVHTWVTYFSEIAPLVSHRWAQALNNLGLPFMILRIFDGMPVVKKDGILGVYSGNIPDSTIITYSVIFFVLITILTFVRLRRTSSLPLLCDRLIVFSCVANPVAWSSYFIPLFSLLYSRISSVENLKTCIHRLRSEFSIVLILLLLWIDILDFFLLLDAIPDNNVYYLSVFERLILSIPTLICIYLFLMLDENKSKEDEFRERDRY